MSAVTDDPREVAPDRLLARDDEAGRALRTLHADPSVFGEEPEAWRQLEQRLDRGRVSRVALRWAAIGAAAGALAVAGWSWSRHRGPLPVAEVREPTHVVAQLALGEDARPLPLPAGRSQLTNGVDFSLSSGGLAHVQRTPRATQVSLSRGTLEVSVTRRPAGQELRVEAGSYDFRVIGTEFRVTCGGEQVELEVRKGRVAVEKAGQRWLIVGAGESWRSAETREADPGPSALPSASPAPVRTPTSSAAPSEPPPQDASACLRLAREHQAQLAAGCYQRVARGQGLSAEMAQLELARLRKDVLHDQRGALSALRDYVSRYPNGSFRTEASISLVELLAQLQPTEALRESERLLASGEAHERRDELYLLRGRILQDRLKDCSGAEREYARIEADRGALGDQAELRRGQCLETLGRSAEAIRVYEHYLGRPSPSNAQLARDRIEALEARAPWGGSNAD